jgi:RHS repeat-associated protein
VKILEVTGGSTTSIKQFIWCGGQRCEVRDSGGTAILAQFFRYGETISGTSYYFSKDHLGSVREMTNSSGTIVWQQSFDPYGVPTTIVNTTAADFGYAGYYLHSRSGLNLTRTRAYNASFGRFINRDRVGELLGGTNLYDYVGNNPISSTDPSGFGCADRAFPPCIRTHKACEEWCYECKGDTQEDSDWRIDCLLYCDKRFPATSTKTEHNKDYDPGSTPQTDPGNAYNREPWLPWWTPFVPYIPYLLPWPGNPLYGGI